MPLLWIVSRIRSAKFVVDWHNYGKNYGTRARACVCVCVRTSYVAYSMLSCKPWSFSMYIYPTHGSHCIDSRDIQGYSILALSLGTHHKLVVLAEW